MGRGGVAVLIACAALAFSARAQAQSSPGQTGTLTDPSLFNWPAAPNFDLGKIDATRFQKWEADKPIDQIDLGASLLRLETVRTPNGYLPRASGDVSDLSDTMMPLRHGKKRYRSSEQYFGLTFTRPTN